MSYRLQLGSWLLAVLLGAGAVSADQNPRNPAADRQAHKPPAAQQRQERRQARQDERRAQGQNPNRPPDRRRDLRNDNRPPDRARNNGNPNRPRYITPDQLRENNKKLRSLPPAERQELERRAAVWQRMTPEQQQHIRSDVAPRWKQMPQDRRQVIRNKLRTLQNMPEPARNRRLNDPNFTRGMSEDDKQTLRDLSHLHVGEAPDPTSE